MIDRNRIYLSTFGENSISLAKEYNLGLEINHTCLSNSLEDSKLKEDILEDIKKASSKNVIIHGPFTEIHPAAIDLKVKDLGLDRLNLAYEITKDISRKMVVHTGWLPFIYFKEYQNDEAFIFWNKFIKDKDINIYIENVLEDEPYMMLDLMERFDNDKVGLCLDIGHLNCMSQVDIYTWIKVLNKYIKHYHIHNNYKDRDSHNRIDDGTIDILKVLELTNDCSITIESNDQAGSLKFLEKNGII